MPRRVRVKLQLVTGDNLGDWYGISALNELKSGRLVFVSVFRKVVAARIDIRIWVEFMNPVKRRTEQDSSD